MPANLTLPSLVPGMPAETASGLRGQSLLVCGLGLIGAYAALQLASLAATAKFRVTLLDRDAVEPHNAANQLFYSHGDVGRPKAEVLAARLRGRFPGTQLTPLVADVAELHWSDLETHQLVAAGLDSLLPRQHLNRLCQPLGIPYVDSGVGSPLLGQVRVIVPAPGAACLECSWGPRHYEQLTLEQPCTPRGSSAEFRTLSPAYNGMLVASLLVGQVVRWFGPQRPETSFEMSTELCRGRLITSSLRRCPHCRFSHETLDQRLEVGLPFSRARVADLLSVATRHFQSRALQFESRRPWFDENLFGGDRIVDFRQLEVASDRPLSACRLAAKEQLIVRHLPTGRAVRVALSESSPVV